MYWDTVYTLRLQSCHTTSRRHCGTQTWVRLTATTLYDARNDEDQQQQHDDAHEYDEPSDRRVTLSHLVYVQAFTPTTSNETRSEVK